MLSKRGIDKGSTMTAEQNKAIIRRYYEEIANQRRFELADEIISPDFRLFLDSQPPYGPEGVKQFLDWLITQTFPDLRVTIEELVAEGDRVAARVTLHATPHLPIDWINGFDTIPVTGKSFAFKEYVFWGLAEGKIVERWILFDQLDMLRQLGFSRFTADFAGQ
jgi:predicted ester cyclase